MTTIHFLHIYILCPVESPLINWTAVGAFGSIIAAIFTIAIAIATWRYTGYTKNILEGNNKILEKNNKLAEYTIYKDFTDKLSKAEAEDLIRACREDKLLIDRYDVNIINAFFSTGFNIKKHLLDILEDLSKFEQDQLISLESVDSGWGYSILYVGNNSEIRRYIKALRGTRTSPYAGLEILYFRILNFNTPEFRVKYNSKQF